MINHECNISPDSGAYVRRSGAVLEIAPHARNRSKVRVVAYGGNPRLAAIQLPQSLVATSEPQRSAVRLDEGVAMFRL